MYGGAFDLVIKYLVLNRKREEHAYSTIGRSHTGPIPRRDARDAAVRNNLQHYWYMGDKYCV